MSNPNVRPDTLRCYACGEFKPDVMFYVVPGASSRRCRHTECRKCQPKLGRLRRERARTFEQVFQAMADRAMRRTNESN